MADIDHDQYNSVSALYDQIETFPQSACYQQMITHALGDCTGKTVLDLGGGTGFHARKAASLGAARVDVVDVSQGMLDAGRAATAQLGMDDKLTWHLGDIALSLAHLPLDKAYDIVMVNWTFDHAESDAVLEAMWANTAAYTAPGGKLVSIRMSSCTSASPMEGRYGVWFTEQKQIPGGWRYVYNVRTTPQFSCPATTMDASLDFEQAKAMAARYGFVDFERVPAEEMGVCKAEPEFWRPYLEDPFFCTVVATKKA